jgi:hypothetical protein
MPKSNNKNLGSIQGQKQGPVLRQGPARDQDLTQSCLSPEVGIDALRKTFCERCRNPVCKHAQAPPASADWQERMATQVDRLLLNPEIVGEGDSRYERFRGMDFPSLLKESIRIIASEQRGDWSVEPLHRVVSEPATEPASFTDATILPDPVETPSETPKETPRELTPKDPEYYKVTEVVTNRKNTVTPTQVAPPPAKPVVIQPLARNTAIPSQGVMIGDSQEGNASDPLPNHDPWNPQSKSSGDRVIPVGGKVRM